MDRHSIFGLSRGTSHKNAHYTDCEITVCLPGLQATPHPRDPSESHRKALTDTPQVSCHRKARRTCVCSRLSVRGHDFGCQFFPSTISEAGSLVYHCILRLAHQWASGTVSSPPPSSLKPWNHWYMWLCSALCDSWRSKFQSLCLRSKHFTYGAIFLAPYGSNLLAKVYTLYLVTGNIRQTYTC